MSSVNNKKRRASEPPKTNAKRFNADSKETKEIPKQFSWSRGINVLQFANARANEIGGIEQILSKKKELDTSTSRHLRRRARSHHSKHGARKAKSSKKPSSDSSDSSSNNRRDRRRNANLLSAANRSSKEFKWLETHIWHAKRMEMVDRWAFRIAYSPRDKGLKFAHRMTKTSCTIQDQSFIESFDLCGHRDSVIKWMSLFISPFSSLKDQLHSQHYMVYKKGCFPFGAVGLIECFFSPEAKYKAAKINVRIWCHPACYDAIFNLFQQDKPTDCTIQDLKSKFVRFSLKGPKSTPILTSALSLSKHNSFASQLLLYIRKEKIRLNTLPNGCFITLSVEDPRINFPPKKVIEESHSGVTITNQCVLDWKIEKEVDADHGFWNLNSISQSSEDKKLKTTEHIHAARSNLIMNRESTNEEKNLMVPILVTQSPGKEDFGSGWDITLPAEWGKDTWLSFIYAGATAIGSKDAHFISLSSQSLTFPEDYIDTDAGRKETEEQLARDKIIFDKLPKSKQCGKKKDAIGWMDLIQKEAQGFTDFYVLRNKRLLRELSRCISSDESSKDDELLSIPRNAFVAICFLSIKDGIPAYNASVYAYIPSITEDATDDTDVAPSSSNKNLSLIGYILKGEYNYNNGKGLGIGYCALPCLLSHCTQRTKYYVSNPYSDILFSVNMDILSEDRIN